MHPLRKYEDSHKLLV